MSMRMLRVKLSLPFLAALIAFLVAAPQLSIAQGPHPEYLHAIRNLREARGLLQAHYDDPNHAQAAQSAIQEIDQAIDNLKQASHSVGKNLAAVPPPTGDLPPEGRFHKASDLLQRAHNDATPQESDPNAAQYRDTALRHLDQAKAIVDKVL